MSSTFWRLSKLHLASLSFTALSLRTPPYFTALMIIRLVLFLYSMGENAPSLPVYGPGPAQRSLAEADICLLEYI